MNGCCFSSLLVHVRRDTTTLTMTLAKPAAKDQRPLLSRPEYKHKSSPKCLAMLLWWRRNSRRRCARSNQLVEIFHPKMNAFMPRGSRGTRDIGQQCACSLLSAHLNAAATRFLLSRYSNKISHSTGRTGPRSLMRFFSFFTSLSLSCSDK